MQRKTNLFYITGNDSNFLTFSNFTESLTGNFLATDWKVYPSRFMCVYMPALLDETLKENFIKNYLVGYYENKLAFLRDYYTEKNKTAMSGDINQHYIDGSDVNITYDLEADINSLSWLFETLEKFKSDNSIEDEDYKITFIGDVTEFDFKGSYTDIICIIDSGDGYNENNKIKNYKITLPENYSNEETLLPYTSEKLYGWTSDELEASSDYSNVLPKFDTDDNKYDLNQKYQIDTKVTEDNSIKFNLIIPLFDIMDVNYVTNFDETGKIEDIDDKGNLIVYTADRMIYDHILQNTKEGRSVNNPLGIWFSDKLIELEKDLSSKYSPSWSLVISTQFKPMPYSTKYDNNDITARDNQQAFFTYAKILSQQSTIINSISSLTARVQALENTVKKFDSLSNNETLQQVLELTELTNELKDKLNNLDNIIEEKVAARINELKLKWK